MTRDRERATRIVAGWRARLDRREDADAEASIRAHPDLEDDLRRRLAVLRRLNEAFGPGGTPPSSGRAGTTLGPYRLVAEIGSGGMGTVFLAVVEGRAPGLAPGARVAVKVLHPHLVGSDASRRRFLREAEFGRRVRHANVVRTLDAGVHAADQGPVHYVVLEHVEGRTLRDVIEDLGQVPEELCRHVGREVALGLGAIHAAGGVHRDVKPENVILTSDHRVRVMDLGVAWRGDDADRATGTGDFAGSVLYAAPEQFRGRRARLDGRADLYALGLVLYEMATGAHAFRADDFESALQMQLTSVPRAAGEVNPQVSPFFEEVLRTLLAKDPAARFGTAGDLAAVLREGERSAWWLTQARRVREETGRPLRRPRVARETAVHGRDRELAALRAEFERAAAGEGRAVLVEGEAGIGKTRLLDEFVASLHRDGEDFEFLTGGSDACGAATESGAFVEALRQHFGDEPSDDALLRALPRTPRLVPAFAALLRGDAPPPDAEPLTSATLRTALLGAVRSLAGERTTVLLIEDLHRAPDESRAAFAALALGVAGHRVMLVGTLRPGPCDVWSADVRRTASVAHVAHVALGRLGPKDLSCLLVDAFRSERLAEEVGFRIAAASDGNPWFVFEILRDLRDRGLLVRGPDGTWSTTEAIRELRLPATVRDLVLARVAALDAEDKDLLDVASCLGADFEAELVADALGRPRLAVLQRLARIAARSRLVRSTGDRFAFDHVQVRETLRAEMPQPLARAYHAALASAEEARTGASAREPASVDSATCAFLAEHFLRGGEGARALPYLGRALAHLESAHRNDAAVDVGRRALDTPGLVTGAERADLLLRLAWRLDVLGRREDERDLILQALALAERDGLPRAAARARGALGFLLLRTGRSAEAEPHLRAAADEARRAGDARTESMAAGNLGTALWSLGRLADARAQLEAALERARALGDSEAEADAHANLGLVLLDLGDVAAARASCERAITLAREHGIRRIEAGASGNLGRVLLALGDHHGARACHERQIAVSREIGDRHGECVATGNVGHALLALGLRDEARTWQERHIALAREIGARRSEAIASLNLAATDAALGDTGSARAHAGQCLAIAQAIGERRVEAYAEMSLAYADRALGRTEAALGHAERGLALARAVGDRAGEGQALHVLADVQGEAPDGETFDGEPAARTAAEAAAVRRAAGDRTGTAASLRLLGALHARAGRTDDARAALDDALAAARELDAHETLVLATATLATLPGTSPAMTSAAEAALDAHRATLELVTALEASFLLWRATGDPARLAEAARLLDVRTAHAPPEDRPELRERVRLHRDVDAALRGAD